ncbi:MULTISPECIES: XRE family transcriptional regulator [unclassified Methylobacterium]|uniref:helix-turn-helix domain-containing protein n=1 Tax=unclassified Methylobacterium TaxID=2615210 RepID=UPI0016505CE6|nr:MULTISPECIES: XRE family transcriptional regulator [unclassified Methylobacterium]
MAWQDEIREARQAKGLSQKALANLVGVSQAAIAKIETKDTQTTDLLDKLCEALGIDAATMPEEAFGRGRVTRPSIAQPSRISVPEYAKDPAYWAAAAGLIGDVPLYASAEGGEGALIIERDPIGSAKRPPLLQGVKDGYAIYHVGDSMVPEFEPGDTLFVNPRLPVLVNTSCVFYNTKADEPRAMVKRFLGSTDEEWRVRQYNPMRDFTLDRAEWGLRHRVVSKNFR